MCRNYELQLQLVQLNEDELRNQLAKSQEIMQNFKDDLRKEQNCRTELEEKFREEASTTEQQLQDHIQQLTTTENEMKELKGKQKHEIESMKLMLCFQRCSNN